MSGSASALTALRLRVLVPVSAQEQAREPVQGPEQVLVRAPAQAPVRVMVSVSSAYRCCCTPPSSRASQQA